MGALGILSRIVRAVAGVIAGILVLGIVLVVLEANERNRIVDAILDVGRFFADPFEQIFLVEDRRGEIAVNWGIAAGVYLLAGALIVALLAALARAVGTRGGRRPDTGE